MTRLLLAAALAGAAAPARAQQPADRWLAQLDSPVVAEREAASDSLAGLGASALPALRARLAGGTPPQRLTAAVTLERMGPVAAPASDDLVAALGDGDRWVRTRASAALGRIGRPAVPALATALADSTRRFFAALALSRIGPDAADAVPALVRAASDGPAVARAEAILALGEIGPPAAAPAVPTIIAALDTPDPWLRTRAMLVLPRFGAEARAARPALERLRDDPNPDVRNGARDALAALGGA